MPEDDLLSDRRSYVDPRVAHAYDEGVAVEVDLDRVSSDRDREKLELAVVRLLTRDRHV